jgi:spermidine synthase
LTSIDIREEKGVRYLHFGTPWVQGAMRIARPWALELQYTRDLMVPLLFRADDWPRRVLQAGLGSASITRFLYRYRPECVITVVEISDKVVAAARQFFKLPQDGRVEVVVADAARYVASTERRFDLVIVDGFDGNGRPGALDGERFYRDCRERLARDGLFAVNLLTRTRGVKASVARLRAAFGESVRVMEPPADGNTIALAGIAQMPDEAELRAAARALRADSGLNLLPALARL